MKFFPKIALFKKLIVIIILIGAVYAGYVWWTSDKESVEVVSAMVLEKVTTGTVTSGIRTTGTIKASEILDLNVYKQTARITSVPIANGARVEAGQTLFGFDESDVAVSIAESQLSIREAELALLKKKDEVTDPNVTIASLKNDISVLELNLSQSKDDLYEAKRDFYNTDLSAEPTEARYSQQINRRAPTIDGLYSGDQSGLYTIYIYASAAPNGFSYRLTGLESGTFEVVFGVDIPLGTRGLTINFPVGNTKTGDFWQVAVPNKASPLYAKAKQDYESKVAGIESKIKTDTVSLANKKVQLEQAERNDTTEDRNLDLESTSLAIKKAQVNLQKNVDTRNERRITAPFSGTVEGMVNVVVGATPSKDSSDTTNFGTLISDEFLVSFSLGAVDVGKVGVGDKVLVNLTSVPGGEALEAHISEVSSLPDSSGVAQYEVLAKIKIPEKFETKLRDGMLADIEIVKEERNDVLRIPVSALSFSEGKAQVQIIENLSEEQEKQFSRLGIVRAENSGHTKYPRTVTVGLRGSYYAEITEGLAPGELILVSSAGEANASPSSSATTPVVRTGFGSGAGGGGGTRPPAQ